MATEINDQLATLKIPDAAVDLDALVWQWPSCYDLASYGPQRLGG